MRKFQQLTLLNSNMNDNDSVDNEDTDQNGRLSDISCSCQGLGHESEDLDEVERLTSQGDNSIRADLNNRKKCEIIFLHEKLGQENETLKLQMTNLQRASILQQEEAEKLRSMLENAKLERDQLTAKWPQVLEKLKQMKESKRLAEVALKSSGAQIQQLIENKLQLEKKFEDLQNENDELKRSLDALTDEKEVLEKEMGDIKLSLEKFQHDYSTLYTEHNELRAHIDKEKRNFTESGSFSIEDDADEVYKNNGVGAGKKFSNISEGCREGGFRTERFRANSPERTTVYKSAANEILSGRERSEVLEGHGNEGMVSNGNSPVSNSGANNSGSGVPDGSDPSPLGTQNQHHMQIRGN